jgi:uncharacterized protein with PQ loop repeat
MLYFSSQFCIHCAGLQNRLSFDEGMTASIKAIIPYNVSFMQYANAYDILLAMDFIAPLYVLAGFFAFAISYPSVHQLIKIKRSDELSLWSWWGWLSYQVIALIYSIDIWAVPYIIINILWIIFYGMMIFLIIRYRPHRVKKRAKRKKRKNK